MNGLKGERDNTRLLEKRETEPENVTAFVVS